MDKLMIEYLRNKNKGDYKDHELMRKFRDFMAKYRRNSLGHSDSMLHGYDTDLYARRHNEDDYWEDDMPDSFSDKDMHKMMRYMRHSMGEEEHFTLEDAEYIVSEMYHKERGKKHNGEKFNMHKAKEVLERYRGIIPHSVTPEDVYVAINAQYHDYVELFKSWFGDNVDQKIIESAIVFWFKDVDSKSENKILDYFKEP